MTSASPASPAAGSQIEHGLALAQERDRRRVPATQPQIRALRRRAGLFGRVTEGARRRAHSSVLYCLAFCTAGRLALAWGGWRQKITVTLKNYKTSAFFADRDDLELAADPAVSARRFLRVLGIACKVGFTSLATLDPEQLAARPKLN